MRAQTYEDRRAASLVSQLTARQREILELVALEYLTNAEIADRLVVSEATVETHVHRILHVLRVHTRGQAARAYIAATALSLAS